MDGEVSSSVSVVVVGRSQGWFTSEAHCVELCVVGKMQPQKNFTINDMFFSMQI